MITAVVALAVYVAACLAVVLIVRGRDTELSLLDIMIAVPVIALAAVYVAVDWLLNLFPRRVRETIMAAIQKPITSRRPKQ